MNKRKNKKKEHILINTTNIITITLCIISLGLLIATCLHSHYINKQQEKNIQELNKILLSNAGDGEINTTEEKLEDIYLSYYSDIDQKATDSINTALAFFGSIFSLVTIVNTIVAVRIPKQFEDSLKEIDGRMKDVERSAKESAISARYVDSLLTKKTIREKIDAITDVIETYGDNSGDLYFSRGFLYDDIKDFDSAKSDYINAKRAGGAEYTYHNSMGVLYSNIMNNANSVKEKMHAFKKSETHYKKAIALMKKLEEKDDYCHCNLACLYQDYAKILKSCAVLNKLKFGKEDLGNYEEKSKEYTNKALKEYDEAIGMSDDYLVAYMNRGITYQEMGEDYYQFAYEDFRKCYEIDSDNERVLELLSETALWLFQKTNDEEYYNVAKINIRRLCKNINKLGQMQAKIDVIESQKAQVNNFDPKKLIAIIDEKIADLSLEEAMENNDNPLEYGNKIFEALEHFKSSKEIYKELYANSQKDEYWSAIERLSGKITKIESCGSNQSE